MATSLKENQTLNKSRNICRASSLCYRPRTTVFKTNTVYATISQTLPPTFYATQTTDRISPYLSFRFTVDYNRNLVNGETSSINFVKFSSASSRTLITQANCSHRFSKQTLSMQLFPKRSLPSFTQHKLQIEFLRISASDSQSITTEIS
jgi:hypothetical protein